MRGFRLLILLFLIIMPVSISADSAIERDLVINRNENEEIDFEVPANSKIEVTIVTPPPTDYEWCLSRANVNINEICRYTETRGELEVRLAATYRFRISYFDYENEYDSVETTVRIEITQLEVSTIVYMFSVPLLVTIAFYINTLRNRRK